ncbi:plasmid replication DNA-binding protein [Psychrobacter sp. APC 3350]|uniref:plasmid replication DNA-binding protein n=1 Tax=Psychrobacter sp. APC 3350 TaxID=3035195 RepID=UPI0025B5A6A6|nr:plasmid replication DNA-binding protein [Psychrobacter sp. APC 3350]MDN3453813.1 plasmid replication DNA-binding protein [Psychrobacter sp. APC 3350]
MNISVTKAAKEWGVSRTTIYQKVNDGELSRTAEKKIDTAEMFRVFGEPLSRKRTEQLLDSTHNTHLESQTVQSCTELEHQLELEKLKNEHLRQQVSDQKHLIENYQQQISQLNKTLDKANASIQDFAQVKLLEFKQFSSNDGPQLEQKPTTTPTTTPKKKRWFF